MMKAEVIPACNYKIVNSNDIAFMTNWVEWVSEEASDREREKDLQQSVIDV